MNEFLRCAHAFFVRDAQLALSYPLAFALSLLTIIARVLALWLPAQFFAGSDLFEEHGGFLPFAIVGASLMGFAMAGYQGLASSVRAEQMMGTLESVLMTRASIFAIVLGGGTWALVRAAMDGVMMLGAAILIYQLSLSGDPAAILLLIVLTNITFMGLGLFSAAFTIVFKQGDPIQKVVAALSLLLGGVIYPTEVLPEWIRVFGEILPITHGARAMRGIVIEGHSLAQHATEVTILTGFAVVITAAGALAFRAAIRQAQGAGTLQHY